MHHAFNLSAGVSRSVGEEGVTVYVEGSGVAFACRAAEGVGRIADGHASEPAIFEHCLPTRTGQPAGDSTRPQVNVAHCFKRYGTTVGDVRELHPAAWAQNSPNLVEHGPLVSAQVDDTVGDDDVGPAVLDR